MLPSQQNLDLAREYETVFGTPEGKRVLAHILNELCGVNQIVPPNNPHLNLGMILGAKNVGLKILEIVKMRFDEVPIVKRHR